MCGILVSNTATAFSHRALESLRKRGPDQMGFWLDGDIRIGHTRLSIIGLDERGAQPLENDTHVLAFNGEIYNFQAIRKRIERAGVRTTTATDSEVLLEAWTLWGPAILADLRGFWSFVIYAKAERKLTLCRDQFGVKPLYYYAHGGEVCVSSLLRTMREHLARPLELDYLALSEYVRYQFTFEDRTFFRDVKKVLPGHIVDIDLPAATVRQTQYDDIFGAAHSEHVLPGPTWAEEAHGLLERCVRESTISDASFTTFCSGGIDSSLITRLSQPEIAYHCNYSDAECNETAYAKQVVDGTGTRLFVVNANENFDLVERLRSIVSDFDEPSIGSVILPLDDLLAQVKRRYKVILTGTGGDELFAGYMRYQLALGECNQESYRLMFDRMSGLDTAAQRFELTHQKGDTSFYRFYEPAAEQSFASAYERCRNGSEVDAMLRFDRRYFLQGLLNIDDKMCGRHSLESRPSFLHQDFVRHVVRLDPAGLFDGGALKPLLRRIALRSLPQSIVQRTDKMGFTTPVGLFVNRSAHLIRQQIEDSPFRDHYELKKMNFTAETKFSREVFGLLMLDLWLNRYATA